MPSDIDGPMPLRRLRLWISAFLPAPALTRATVPAPPAAPGGSMICVPTSAGGRRCFLGDDRGYSTDPDAPARIHSRLLLTGLHTPDPVVAQQWHRCGESVEIRPDSGTVVARATAATDRVAFEPLRIGRTGEVIIEYHAAAALPLIAGAPDITMAATFIIDPAHRRLRCTGTVDSFPAFESYAAAGDAPPVTLFTFDPTTPAALADDLRRPVDVTVGFDPVAPKHQAPEGH